MIKKDKKPKALVLAYKNFYLNNTDEVFYESLKRIFEVTFYGPGYVPLEELILDARKIYDTHGPFDICFIHQYVSHNLYSYRGEIHNDSPTQHFYFDTKFFNKYCTQFGDNYNDLPGPKCLISMRSDVYMFTEKEEEEFAEFKGHLIMPPSECIAPLCKQSNVDETFLKNASDRFIKFSKNNPNKIIPATHLIASSDFIQRQKRKFYAVSVPGAPYAERILAYNNLKSAGYTPKARTLLDKILTTSAAKLRLSLMPKVWNLKYRQAVFKSLISRSQVTFTNGSAVQIPVRKFFEIPAYGSLLAATPFFNASDLGFVSGKTFVSCDAQSIADVVSHAQKNPCWAQEIIQSSQAMVFKKHSEIAWAGYLEKIYALLKNNRFKSAKWINGEFTVE